MTETSATKPPQLRAARARKQSIIKFVILFVTLAFLFVPLLAMLIFTLRHPLSGRWSAAGRPRRGSRFSPATASRWVPT